MNIFKSRFISRKAFIIIIIIFLLGGIFFFYRSYLNQNRLDQEFEESRPKFNI